MQMENWSLEFDYKFEFILILKGSNLSNLFPTGLFFSFLKTFPEIPKDSITHMT